MNKVFLVGRLVADPESYTTKTGNAQARITIATQDNRVKTESYFFPCVAWQNTANFINTYL
ncbi:MAG: single-stranded DNA-binding protein, partial [Mycoplasmataceae bacterium]|nr:single-stranded DNA-binding protein [Mycoplasmataceae bacterium]